MLETFFREAFWPHGKPSVWLPFLHAAIYRIFSWIVIWWRLLEMLIHIVKMDESLIWTKSRIFWKRELNRISSCLGYHQISGEGKISLAILRIFIEKFILTPSNTLTRHYIRCRFFLRGFVSILHGSPCRTIQNDSHILQ